jgi:hypothetical protein
MKLGSGLREGSGMRVVGLLVLLLLAPPSAAAVETAWSLLRAALP